MDVVDLTRKLVSIPSYVDTHVNEAKVGEFIESYLQGLGYLRIERQPVEGQRFNVIAHDGHPARLMFCCHMDTVHPSRQWKHDPFGGAVEDGRVYGLGAVDMKGGTAALLEALQAFKTADTRGLYLLFDVDEEYEFKGMRRFIEACDVHPALAVLPEPGFSIQNGHRGLLELHFRVMGKTAHASRPRLGKNAIEGAADAVRWLKRELAQFSDPVMGVSSCNLAALTGGVLAPSRGGDKIATSSPNMVPNVADVILDIRPASAALRAETVERILRDHLGKRGFELIDFTAKLNYGSLLVPQEQLAPFESIVRQTLGSARYADIRRFGYGEGQMLNERLGAQCVYFGPEKHAMAHQPDEYVTVASLRKARDVFAATIRQYCAG